MTSVIDDVGIMEMTLPAKVAFVLASGTHMYLMCKELAAGCVKMTFRIT